MGKKPAIVLAVCVLLVAGLIATYNLLPKRYLVGERLSQATVFWNDKEAFVFLDLMKTGRSQNIVQEKIASQRWGLLFALSGFDFSEQHVMAYRFTDSGALENYSLPENATLYGKWKLAYGNLQLTPTASAYRSISGFRWNGSNFQSVPAEAPSTSGARPQQSLSEDDDDDDSPGQWRIADKEERSVLRNAGWHWKTVSGYAAAAEGDASLRPQTAAGRSFDTPPESSGSEYAGQ